MIGLADVDVTEIDQIRQALTYGAKKLKEIRHRMQELKAMEEDMLRIRQRLVDRFETLQKGKTDG